MKDPFSHAFKRELTRTLVAANGKKKREVLTQKRDVLFAKFLRNPEEIHLALEIKFIDESRYALSKCDRRGKSGSRL